MHFNLGFTIFEVIEKYRLKIFKYYNLDSRLSYPRANGKIVLKPWLSDFKLIKSID